MIKFSRSILLVAALALTGTATAASKEEERVADATDVVNQLIRIPEQSVPPALLRRAYGIAVIPNVLKAGFVLGARHGKGVLVVRQDDGSWSNPAFIKLTGGSIGWQAGAQSTDVILVFKTRQSVDGITKGKLTLGGDASVAAGPVGRETGVATDIRFQAEVYSYSRSRGLFAGLSIEGAGISIDKRSNAAFYGSSSITADEIFASGGNAAPAVANDFVQILTSQTQQQPSQQPSTDSDTDALADGAEPKNKVRTFGVSSPESGDPESDEVAKQY